MPRKRRGKGVQYVRCSKWPISVRLYARATVSWQCMETAVAVQLFLLHLLTANDIRKAEKTQLSTGNAIQSTCDKFQSDRCLHRKTGVVGVTFSM